MANPSINLRIQRLADDRLAALADLNDEYEEELARHCYSVREAWHAWSLLAQRKGELAPAASIEDAWRAFAALPGMDDAWFRRAPYAKAKEEVAA